MRLHPLLTGELLAPPALWRRRRPAQLTSIGIGVPKSKWVWIPVPAFLIEHPTEGPLVVDAGLHPAVAEDPRPNFGPIGSRLYEFRVTPEQGVSAQLRARGVEPADLRTVVMTHLHLDHASGMSELADATFLVTPDERRAASRRIGALDGYHRPQFAGRSMREIEAREAHGPFERTHDLFGDGTVRLVFTPGHTAGHQSVLVRLADREALICGDAAYTLSTIRDSVMPGRWHSARAFRRSLAQIQRFVTESPEAVVIPGHDPDAWARLEQVYA